MTLFHHHSWNAASAALMSYQEANDRNLFRGMASSAWQPRCSYERTFANHTDDAFRCGGIAAAFAERCAAAGIHLDDDAVAAVGQHHGLPTRVIDFTTAYLVGAFFAARSWIDEYLKSPSTAHQLLPIVWVLDTSGGVFSRVKLDARVPLVEVLKPAASDERIRAQRGTFVVHHTGETLTSALGLMDLGDRLVGHTFPPSEVPSALVALAALGFDDERLFPGISGIVRASIVQAILPSML